MRGLIEVGRIKLMPVSDFKLLGKLGKGSYSVVHRCLRVSDGEKYAMKRIHISKLKEKDQQNALNEIRFLASINHPNIISYREAFYEESDEHLCLVMDLAEQGDLSSFIRKHQKGKTKFTERQIWKVGTQCLSALDYLHSMRIVHRDIKTSNIFIDEANVKLGDLNVAKHLKNFYTDTQTGTPFYASPQVWKEQPYNEKCDIWSLGCVLYEMATLHLPFNAPNTDKLYEKVILGKYEPIPDYYSHALSEFIRKMLILSQKFRPNSADLLKETLFSEYIPKREKEVRSEGNLEIKEELIATIEFPKILKNINERLPGTKYGTKSKSTKTISDLERISQRTSEKVGHPRRISLLGAGSNKSNPKQ